MHAYLCLSVYTRQSLDERHNAYTRIKRGVKVRVYMAYPAVSRFFCFIQKDSSCSLVCLSLQMHALLSKFKEFWKLGLGPPFACSAVEGVGLSDLLDR